jgi:hypothetical protein
MATPKKCDVCKNDIEDGRRRSHLGCVVQIYDQRAIGSLGEKAVHSLNRILGTGEWTIVPEDGLQVTDAGGVVLASGNFWLKVDGVEVAHSYGDAQEKRSRSDVAESAKLDALVRCLNQFRM